MNEQFTDELRDLKDQLHALAPNSRARERFNAAKSKYEESSTNFTKAKMLSEDVTLKFDKVKDDRYIHMIIISQSNFSQLLGNEFSG